VGAKHEFERRRGISEAVARLRYAEDRRPVLRVQAQHLPEEVDRLVELPACEETGTRRQRLAIDEDLATEKAVGLLVEIVVALSLLLG
jgi:hypothetical protein